uniref:Uncharacterized protein n=1 Tax=Arundo donax TaxID=35708 RepID=A0A0A9AY04_ARUDO
MEMILDTWSCDTLQNPMARC